MSTAWPEMTSLSVSGRQQIAETYKFGVMFEGYKPINFDVASSSSVQDIKSLKQ